MSNDTDVSISALASRLEIGDVVFARVVPRPFRQVAEATDSWTNHVGIVVEFCGADAIVAESKFPLSRRTSFDGTTTCPAAAGRPVPAPRTL